MMNHSASSLSVRTKRSFFALLIGATICLPNSGCKIPELCKPKAGAALPAAFDKNNDANLAVVDADNSALLGWREFFDDPTLNNLICEALTGNQELKILAQDIRIANNEIMVRRGSLFPFISYRTEAGIEKSSRFTRNGAVEHSLDAAPGKGFPEPLPNFLLAADVSWEIDIWKKLRNARDAASLRYLGTQAGRNYVVTRLVSEVAENYYELLSLDNQLMTLEKTIEIQKASHDAALALKEAARGTELAVQRFQAEVEKNESKRLIILQEITEAENRINTIAGRFPQKVERPSLEFIELSLKQLALGVPSDQLRNRADIRQAEREVQAAGLDVNVARAEFYPSLVLTAGVGYEAFNTKYLFDSPESLIYGAAGGLVGPLVNRAAIKAEYMNANARQLQSIYEYQQTIIEAHTEVVNQLSMVDNYNSSIDRKKKQLASLEASVDNANKLFQSARGEYIEVLLAQRELMEARMEIIETKQKQLTASIRAYQALGGGGRPGDFTVDQIENFQDPDENMTSEFEEPPVIVANLSK